MVELVSGLGAQVEGGSIMTLVNRKSCRQFMLDYAERSGKPLTQVQSDIYDWLDVKIREACRFAVDHSVGKTVALTTKKRDSSDRNI